MTGSNRIILLVGAVFSVALLLSVAVLSPFSAEYASADDGMSDEEKKEYAEMKIAEMNAELDAQMREAYGISYEEYAAAAEFLMENSVVLTSDEDGNIVADTLDSVERGKCLGNSGFSGDNFNIYIDSVTWSTMVFFLSNDFVNLAVDEYTAWERNHVISSEQEYSSKVAEYNVAVADYNAAVGEYNTAYSEFQESSRKYEESKIAYDNSVIASDRADAEVVTITGTVNSLQAQVEQEQAEVDRLQTVCDEKKEAALGSIDELIDSAADSFCNVTLCLAAVSAEQDRDDGQLDDLIVEMFHTFSINSYVNDALLLGAFGLTIASFNEVYAVAVIEKLYSLFKITDLVSKDCMLKMLTNSIDFVSYYKSVLLDKIRISSWYKTNSAVIKLNNQSAGASANIKDLLEEAKTNIGQKSSEFKTFSKQYMSYLSQFTDNTKTVLGDTVTLKTYQKQMEEAIKIADANEATELSKLKAKEMNMIDKEIKESKVLAKEAVKNAKNNAIPLAKKAMSTAWETLKSAKQGLAIAKEAAKKVVAETGKIACKAALKAAFSCFGIISIIIDVVVALVMKFIIEQLNGQETENGIEISIKVRHYCRFWFWCGYLYDFPSLNYIRPQ